MKGNKQHKELSDEIITVTGKDGKVYAMNWRGKLISADKAMSPKMKSERRSFIKKMTLVFIGIILVMTVLWFFLMALPALV